MAKYGVVKNAYIKVGNTDLSDHCIDLQPSYGNGAVQAHGMSANQEYSNPGLRTRSITAKFINDFASASVFATLNPLKNGAKHVLQYRNDATAATALNPTYSGLFFISSITGLVAGTLGGNSECSVTWMAAGEESELTS